MVAVYSRGGLQGIYKSGYHVSDIFHCPREKPATEPAKANIQERIGDIKKHVAECDIDAEQAQEMLKKIHEIREKFRSDGKNRARKR